VGSCATKYGGSAVRDRIRIPSDFPESEHTLLQMRWDSGDTAQVYVGCSDVKIL
jgi:predicted carbohydrate-binding protein with CBM5 and CBM33 domain